DMSQSVLPTQSWQVLRSEASVRSHTCVGEQSAWPSWMHCTHWPALASVVAQKSSAPLVFTMQRPSASVSELHGTQVKVPAIPLSQSDASGELGQSLSVTHWWHSPVLVSQRRPSGQFAVPIVLHGWQVPPTQIGLAASGHG